MNPRKDAEKNLDRALERLGRPRLEDMESARERVRQTLRSKAGEESPLDVRPVSLWRLRQPYMIAAAAALVFAVSLAAFRHTTIDAHATVQSADGSFSRVSGEKIQIVHLGDRIEPGEILRTNDASATIALADGSRVEMRSRSEFTVERASDGVRIHLFSGGLIINAAKQLAGHLYVQTRDVTVSVVGTVFLVNAEEEGSRVAVIEGEVRVQQGSTTKNLLPGEQLTTNPMMEKLPVKDELSWSSHAELHVALLQQSTAASRTPETPVRLEFAAASIRPLGPGEPVKSGLACHGVDGIRRADSGEKGNLGFSAPQGRCAGGGVSLARLIGFAFGIPHLYGPDTPDWARPYTNPTGPPRQAENYVIDAVADDPATVTTEQLRQMTQTMLIDRFKLKTHREMQDVPGYVLVVAKGGTKLKSASGEEELPFVDYSTLQSLGGPTLKGKSRLDKLIQFVSAFVNPTGFVTSQLPTYVTDRTGLTGIYEYQLVMPVPGGASGRTANPVPQGIPGDRASSSFAWRGPAFADAMEDQLGLEMKVDKTSIEVLVVDHVERPSEN